MTMQSEQRLTLLNESPHCNTANVHVEWNVLIGLPVKSGAIEGGVIRGRMKQENCPVKGWFGHERF